MNKLLIGTILAAGLLLVNSPEAVAHDIHGAHHVPPRVQHAFDYRRDARGRDYYRHYQDRKLSHDKRHKRHKRYERAKYMPGWMQRDHSFIRWLNRTRLDRDRTLTWRDLFHIYVWEQTYRRHTRY